MVSCSVKFSFEAAHRLPEHTGKCHFLHGHSYRGEVYVTGPVLGNGMVMDFSDLKRVINKVVSTLDHKTILRYDDPLRECLKAGGFEDSVFFIAETPTAETLVALIAGALLCEDLLVEAVQLNETEDNAAIWRA